MQKLENIVGLVYSTRHELFTVVRTFNGPTGLRLVTSYKVLPEQNSNPPILRAEHTGYIIHTDIGTLVIPVTDSNWKWADL
jgi:hypothetical protein